MPRPHADPRPVPGLTVPRAVEHRGKELTTVERMRLPARTLSNALWAGLALSIAGRAFDLQWHVTHDEFETASDQLRAHWLAWLGAFVLLAAAALALAQGHRGLAVAAVVIGAVGYSVVAVWHFYEHSQHRDPDLPHVLLTVAQIAMLVGTPFAARFLHRQQAGANHA